MLDGPERNSGRICCEGSISCYTPIILYGDLYPTTIKVWHRPFQMYVPADQASNLRTPQDLTLDNDVEYMHWPPYIIIHVYPHDIDIVYRSHDLATSSNESVILSIRQGQLHSQKRLAPHDDATTMNPLSQGLATGCARKYNEPRWSLSLSTAIDPNQAWAGQRMADASNTNANAMHSHGTLET